jgi:TonB family protein
MNSAVAQDTWRGKIVNGRFPLQEWLGSSEGSNVFLTEVAGGKAALKLIPVPDAGKSQEQLAQWKLISRLSHPNLLRIFDAGTCAIKDSQFLYVVMEYAEEDLSQVLPVRPLTAKEAREMLTPLVSVLSFLHGQGLTHAAIRPSNILAVENQLKLSSDRIRSLHGAKLPLRARGQYDAPEISAGEVSSASDIWSLGATLTAAFGQRMQTAELSTASEPEIQRYVPEPFRQIARECLRRNPGERCTLPRIKTLLDPATPGGVSVPFPPKKDKSRILPIALLCAALVVAALLVSRGARHNRLAPAPIPSATTQRPKVESKPAPPASRSGAVAEQNIPNVPASARNTVTGKVRVIVGLTVDTAGNVSDAKLVSPGPSKYFARIALESARQWKFQPPTVEGSPASSAWTLRYLFGRAGTEVIPAPAK